MYSALIVDDERLARQELARLLTDGHAERLQVVAQAATVGEAATLARLHDPDVVFLDVHLGGESGFDLLPLLDAAVDVVFVTAFDRYAIRAFEVNAIDYLLKPVAPERLAAAVARLGRSDVEVPPVASPLTGADRLFLRLDERMGFVRVRDIVAVLAAGDGSLLRLADGRRAHVRKPLREWAERLPAQEFLRIHRSTMVNLDFVDRVEEWSHLSFRVHLRGMAEPLHMSRRWAVRVRARLG